MVRIAQRARESFEQRPLGATKPVHHGDLVGQGHVALHSAQTLILDEIHVLVGTKRGAHLALSLERLEEGGRLDGVVTACKSPFLRKLEWSGLSFN
ncbi:MAG: hypothetical protein IH919_04365 [Deltaproteobacteria bacterium]|nr:hypothetical protein [Deltaproteobacteria bacterium]